MNQDPKIEYLVALNIMGLTPRDLTYWRAKVGDIRADLANLHGIHADILVGLYAGIESVGCQPFHLYSFDLNLYTEEGLADYREAESKVEKSIQRYTG